MHERLAQVLGAGLAALVLQVDLVGVAVVAERARVLDGEVGELVVVVAGRVAALGDQPGDQLVGVADRAARGCRRTGSAPLPRPPSSGRRDSAESGRQLQLGVLALAFAQLMLGFRAAGVVSTARSYSGPNRSRSSRRRIALQAKGRRRRAPTER